MRVRRPRAWCKQPKIVLVGTTKLRLFYSHQVAPERSSSRQEEDPTIDSGFPFCGVVVGRWLGGCKKASHQIRRTLDSVLSVCFDFRTHSTMLYPDHCKNGYFIVCSADGWSRICVPRSFDFERGDLCGLQVSTRSMFQTLLKWLRIQ